MEVIIKDINVKGILTKSNLPKNSENMRGKNFLSALLPILTSH